MYRVRILVDGFVMGTTAYPKGSEMEVNLPVYNYLTAERKAELVDDNVPVDAPEKSPAYHRRDMQAEDPRAIPPVTPRETKVEAPVPAAKPKSKRGRPPGAKNKRKK